MSGITTWGEPLDGAPQGDGGDRPSGSEAAGTAGLLLQIQDWYRVARDHWHDWRKEAEQDFDFVAGHQWDEEDLQRLQEQMRPTITINRIGPYTDSVAGMEIQNRQETRYIPRQLGSSGVAELETGAAKWARDECDAEDEESDAFLDLVICGVGATQTTMSYDDDPEGMPVVCRVDPLEILWDPNARRKNFMDAQYVIRCKDVPIETARDLFPGKNNWELDASWAKDGASNSDDPHNRREAPYYRNDQSSEIDRERQRVRMVEIEWYEWERGYTVSDPTTGKKQHVTSDQHDKLQARARQLSRINPAFPASYQSVPFKRKKYRRAIVGGIVLLEDDGPERGGFTIKAITGKRDRKYGTYYGLVRAMKDPQCWANKFFSQALHIINSNAKGGLIVEAGAFENPHEAADQWAAPDGIVEVAAGSLSNANGPRVIPKPIPAYPQSQHNLMQIAIDAIPSVSGMSPELMAQADRNQPGVLEMSRKQQGMVILAGFFDSMRRYRKESGRLMLWLIQTFISDGRLIRIGGPEDAKYVPLVRSPDGAEYDIVVDDTPSSPNMKERVWAQLMQMMPVLRTLPLPPTAWIKLMEYSPFPPTLVSDIGKDVQQQMQMQQSGQNNPMEQARIKLDQAKGIHLQAQAQHELARAAQAGALAEGDVSYKQAQTESLRSTAAMNLAKVGIDHADMRFQQLMDAVDALLRLHGVMNPPQPPGGMQPQPSPGPQAGPVPFQGQGAPAPSPAG